MAIEYILIEDAGGTQRRVAAELAPDGSYYQVQSVAFGADGSAPVLVSASNPLPTTGPLTDAQLRASAVAVDTELPTAAALSDSISNPTAPQVGAAGEVWDAAGSVWKRRLGGVATPGAGLVEQASWPNAKGKTHNAVSVSGGGATSGADLTTAGYKRLHVFARLTASASGDVDVAVYPYEDDGITTQNVAGLPRVGDPGAALGGGVAYKARSYDLHGLEKVRVVLFNNNAGSQTGTVVYFLQR